MARYVDDYRGIIGHDTAARGMDPNYSGGYRGMRMGGSGYQAAYGRYRLEHAEDFGGSGGFRGRSGPASLAGGGRTRAPHGVARYDREMEARRAHGYDSGWESGGVRDLRYDRDLLREFNANSPGLRTGGRYDREHVRRLPHGVAPWSRGRGNWEEYSNRGLTDAGYSEGWARGPMRGAR